MYMSLLHKCMSVLYVCGQYPWRPEEGINFLGIGVTKLHVSFHVVARTQTQVFRKQPVFIITEPSLQPL